MLWWAVLQFPGVVGCKLGDVDILAVHCVLNLFALLYAVVFKEPNYFDGFSYRENLLHKWPQEQRA